jgi:hypothetical protein
MEATFNIKQGDRVVAMSDADLRHNFGFNPFTEKPSEGRHIERSRRHDMSKRDRFVDNLIDFSVSNLDFLVKAAIVGGVAYLVLWAGGRMLGWTKVN